MRFHRGPAQIASNLSRSSGRHLGFGSWFVDLSPWPSRVGRYPPLVHSPPRAPSRAGGRQRDPRPGRLAARPGAAPAHTGCTAATLLGAVLGHRRRRPVADPREPGLAARAGDADAATRRNHEMLRRVAVTFDSEQSIQALLDGARPAHCRHTTNWHTDRSVERPSGPVCMPVSCDAPAPSQELSGSRSRHPQHRASTRAVRDRPA